MSIINAKALASIPSRDVRLNDASPQKQAEPFSRKATVADVIKAETAMNTNRAEVTTAAKKPPFSALATELCGAGDKLRLQLDKNGVKNPSYLGSYWGSTVHSNPANSEVVVRHLRVKTGLLDRSTGGKDALVQKDKSLNLQNFDNMCQVKKDGRIIFNGETLTTAHPDHVRVLEALDAVLNKVSNDKLNRFGFVHSARDLPWLPGSQGHSKYVD
ncbi:hypothetical protein ACSFA3_17365 [Variovorax sp. RHLX14]|uniref:hypothetical protein n=1 Tax=Variovorax sp. RHLX14 TaxID=1259731 RepID=UPI003F4647B3